MRHPLVVMLHGWNGEVGYYYQFPLLARRLNRHGINAAMIELPYHGRRRPRGARAMKNFISDDLAGVVEATQQALADIGAIQAWGRYQGCNRIGVWGFSMGAWLGGLSFCHSSETHCLAMTTPVCDMDQVIRELPFCEPIRRSLAQSPVCLEKLSLQAHRPNDRCQNVLIVASQYDQFSPAAIVDKLWEDWSKPDIWRVNHGHISVLLSLPVMERTVKWLAMKLNPPRFKPMVPRTEVSAA
jgi:dienelactone hydrolase